MSKPDVEHNIPPQDWLEFTREIIYTDREVTKADFRQILKEELQTSQDTIKRVDKLEKTNKWMIASHVIQGLILVLLLIKELLKHT